MKGKDISNISNWADFIRPDSKYNETWCHFVSLPINKTEDYIKNIIITQKSENVFMKINEIINMTDIDEDNLKLLIHYIQDIHQPLHNLDYKRGGNEMLIYFWGKNVSLHELWDSFIINKQDLSYKEYSSIYNNYLYQEDLSLDNKELLINWIYENYKLASEIVKYNYTNFKYYDYEYKYLPVINFQLYKSGYRLSHILNNIFKNKFNG